MSSEKNLQAAIQAESALTQQQKDELFGLLVGRTRADTRDKLARRINLPLSLWPSYGIFSRVHFDADGGVSYCAGQHYPSETAYIRSLILKD